MTERDLSPADQIPTTAGQERLDGAASDRSPGRPRRVRGATVAMSVAGLMLAGGIGGVVVDTVQTSDTEQAAIAATSSTTSSGAEATPASSTVDPGTYVDEADGVLLVNSTSPTVENEATGMVLSSDGLAITNDHVVAGASEVEVTVADTGATYPATVVERDPAHDIAVLQLQDASGLETITVDPSVEFGEEVSAIGNAWGQGYLTEVSGTVTGVGLSITAENANGPDELSGMIATDADVVTGYSGGPLVDDDGEVVGLSTAASTGTTADEINGYAIPITEAIQIAE